MRIAIARTPELPRTRGWLQVCSVYVFVNWLANVMLQLYLRRAMQRLYTGTTAISHTFSLLILLAAGPCSPYHLGAANRLLAGVTRPWVLLHYQGQAADTEACMCAGLFKHVLFQDSTFYDSISTSELAT